MYDYKQPTQGQRSFDLDPVPGEVGDLPFWFSVATIYFVQSVEIFSAFLFYKTIGKRNKWWYDEYIKKERVIENVINQRYWS